jgi:hypothetical protein
MIKHQVHSKFKVFISDAESEDAVEQLFRQADVFTKDNSVAPKSIGVEYLEGQKRLILSIGYRDDEPGYPVNLKSVLLGKLAMNSSTIEAALEKAADETDNVICHEFFVTEGGDFVMVLLSHG